MTVYFFGSLGSSPGTSTTATALALNWPRPVLMVEADTSKPSGAILGLMRGNESSSRGLQALSLHYVERARLDDEALWDQTVPLADRDRRLPEPWEKWLLPAFKNPAAGQGMTRFWGELAAELATLRNGAVDVIVDAGRIHHEDPRLVLAEVSEVAVVTLAHTLTSVISTKVQLEALSQRLESIDKQDPVKALVHEVPAKGYGEAEIGKILQVPVLGTVPWDPASAAVFSNGAEAGPRFHRKPLPGAIASIGDKLRHATNLRKQALMTETEASA